ncbi:hypothetical protein C1646_778389 [Rhizophagus diaphanus]|nr:hypothetical protein C1646_778389 [Rhizophagus diaphanus] [Rhizophagus sp. MUCL 43196]
MGFDLGSKMSEITEITEITLNCLIVPVGDLIDVPCNEVKQTITIARSQTVGALESAIRFELRTNTPLSIRQIHPGSVNERPMQSQTPISHYFNGEQELQADFFHVTVYPQ